MSTLYDKATSILNEKTSKIIPTNIRENVEIFKVIGEVQELNTSDATAVAGDILLNKTAYAKGRKITGTLDLGRSVIPTSELSTNVKMDEVVNPGDFVRI